MRKFWVRSTAPLNDSRFVNGWKRAREGNTVELCGACALRRHGRVLCDVVRWAWFYFKDKNTEAVEFERGSKRLDLIEGPILLSYSEGPILKAGGEGSCR